MIEFFYFILIVFSAVWGSVFLGAYLRRLSKDHDSRPDDLLLEGLREDTQEFETRLARVEEELSFLRELNRPESSARLRSPEPDDS